MKATADGAAARNHGATVAEPKPGRSPVNRSLERGIELLRAFRPGTALLGNAELAERTGLSRATVSRLTQTLVGAGMLQVDAKSRACRLAPGVLSLAHAMRSGCAELALAAPIMRQVAETSRVNVGLAAPDRDEMVYLESIRYNRRAALRKVVSGQRVPIELTSLGRAYLYGAPEARRKALLALFKRRRGAQWPALSAQIRQAMEQMQAEGYCVASWQPEVVALATNLRGSSMPLVVNVSVSTGEPLDQVVGELAPVLLAMARRIEVELRRTGGD
ncbi:helix-turn-helix domain-containing protein [Ramlibacter sp.]|uniref:IclR family transcriptional regulator n=1 Tax=Ramlibacter sp. TaxID=1917967 RepID=UPI00260ADAA6|nr:helix-turn-helix domain-containing protein [Ramlibacter sp.]MDB5957180.1 IclR family transcriptional regulator [Ramlibacter sp.]